MPYGEIFIKGKSKKTIYLTTYICHPNLANDNLSGILMLSNLVRHLKSASKKINSIILSVFYLYPKR